MNRNGGMALRELIQGAGVDRTLLGNMAMRIMAKYWELGAQLPDNHAWKHGKRLHAERAAQEARELASLLGMNELEAEVLSLLLLSHDIGRLQEGILKEVKGDHGPFAHGEYSATIFKALEPIEGKQEFWHALMLAILHHDAIDTPGLSDLENNEAAYALLTLLRDLDKAAGFEKGEKYVSDEGEKARQIVVNNLRGETGTIDDNLLARAESGKLINRKDCVSYEDFMLQLLCWRFDIQNPEIWEWIVRNGWARPVVGYLENKLTGVQLRRFHGIIQNMGL
jgi:hypothetical protein